MDIIVPAEQEGTKAVVKTWLKKIGEPVAKDEPVVELETDKVVLEIAAPCAGTLVEILVAPDSDAVPGMILGKVTTAQDRTEPVAVAAALPSSFPETESRGTPQPFDPELRLSPAVRKLVAEHGVDPSALIGSGRNGRLTREDVLAAAEARQRPAPVVTVPVHARPAPAPARAATVVPVGSASGSESRSTRIPHDSMRRRIAEHMQHSLSSAPHVTAVFEADFSAIMAHRKASKAAFEAQGVSLTYTTYIVSACIAAMQAAPAVNSRWHDDFLEMFDDVNIGVGTALGDAGLIVPVIHKAQDLSLLGIATRLQDLTHRARNGKLKLADVQNGTFSISNHGVSGSLLATPIIINQPQSAILGVGALEKRVVVRTIDGIDSIQIRPIAYVSLSIDHRVVDGAQTNAWLKRFVDTIEHWKG